MIELTLNQIAQIVNGEVINADGGIKTSAFPVINSNQATDRTFFAAFMGEKVDGHDFIADAISKGAQFALVSKSSSFPAIKVADVRKAVYLGEFDLFLNLKRFFQGSVLRGFLVFAAQLVPLPIVE